MKKPGVVTLAITAALALIVGAGAAGAAGSAESAADAPPPSGSAAFRDVDGDGLDDGLFDLLEGAQPQDRLNVIVTFNGPSDEAGARRAVGSFDTYARFSVVSGFAATMTVAQIRGLSRTPGVFRIEPDSIVATTSDSANADFGTSAARATHGVDGAGVNICVVDTGADPTHEQLDNGKITKFKDYVGQQVVAYDDQGHGTHVASIAAGDGVGGSADAATFAGVAPGASIMSAKVLDSTGNGSESNIVLALGWCVDEGADIISMSLGAAEGADGADAMSQAVNNISDLDGIPVVVAAGNSGDGAGTILAPGAASSAITVGAVAEASAPPSEPNHSNGIHLAGFSSRGPTSAGVMKPDIVAPGDSITAASANSTSGYVTFSGTSMATPFVAGTLALALERQSALSPAQLKGLLTSTAQDRGIPGSDQNWGAGLLDGMGVVSAADGDAYAPTAFPRNENGVGSVATGGVWSHDFAVGADDLSTPIGITMLINGQAECPLFCFMPEWNPDLEARLFDPLGAELAISTCPFDLQGHCGTLFVSQGQQETLAVMPTVAGTYRMEVWPVAGGGTFTYDISAGAPGSPAPNNPAPTADAGPDQTVVSDGIGTESVTLDGSGSSDDSAISSYRWVLQGTTIATGVGPTVDLAEGVHDITLVVTDDQGASASDTVRITISPYSPPTANAGPDQTVLDTKKKGTEKVTLDGSSSRGGSNAIATYSWRENGNLLATGATPSATLSAGTHTIDLTVTDTNGVSSTDSMILAIVDELPPPPPPEPPSEYAIHVHDLAGSAAPAGRNKWTAEVDVFVVGTQLELMPEPFDFIVGIDPSTVTFSVSTGGTVQCITEDDPDDVLDGRCTVVVSELGKGAKSVTLTVISVVAPGFEYIATDNHDADGSSDGTSITIAAP